MLSVAAGSFISISPFVRPISLSAPQPQLRVRAVRLEVGRANHDRLPFRSEIELKT